MVNEFLKNVGLLSTGKIFEVEAGLAGIEENVQWIVNQQFSFLTPSTPDQVQPSQALHIWKADAVERQAAEFVED